MHDCLIRYAGKGDPAIYAYQCSPNICNNRIEFAPGDGIYASAMAGGEISNNIINACEGNSIELHDSAPLVANNTITNFGNGYAGNPYDAPCGIFLYNQSNPLIIDNTILADAGYPLYFENNAIPFISGNNISAGYGYQAFGFDQSPPSTALTNIEGLGWPYVFFDNLTIGANTTLTIPAGTVLMGGDGAQIIVQGIMDAQSTLASPVVFTYYTDSDYYDGDDAGIISSGTWMGISIRNGFDSLNNCIVRGAGGNTGFCVEALNCSPTIQNNVIEGGFADGIYASGMDNGLIANNLIQDCNGNGIELNLSAPQISGNTISNNGLNGIYVASSTPTITSNTITTGSSYPLYFQDSAIPFLAGNSDIRGI